MTASLFITRRRLITTAAVATLVLSVVNLMHTDDGYTERRWYSSSFTDGFGHTTTDEYYGGYEDEYSYTPLSRKLMTQFDDSDEIFAIPSDETLQSLAENTVDLPTISFDSTSSSTSSSVAPYSIHDALNAIPIYDNIFALLIYSPNEDAFITYYSQAHRWIPGCHKLMTAVEMLCNSLRFMFPDMFNGDVGEDGKKGNELVLAVSSGDYPGISMNECVRSGRWPCFGSDAETATNSENNGVRGSNISNDIADLPPILQFGSSFSKPVIPTMIAMPMPQQDHMACYHDWSRHPELTLVGQGPICEYYKPKDVGNGNGVGLVFADNSVTDVGGASEGGEVLTWDKLIPQVVWRGTDFSYLHKMQPWLRPPDFNTDVGSSSSTAYEVDVEEATRKMRSVYEELIPRWKGVVWTAEAELSAESDDLPWANIKFASFIYKGKKTPTSQGEVYQQFEMHGIPAVGEGMSLETLATYKYHIDIGGGGGTTWVGLLRLHCVMNELYFG
jgi:hypothetical protein